MTIICIEDFEHDQLVSKSSKHLIIFTLSVPVFYLLLGRVLFINSGHKVKDFGLLSNSILSEQVGHSPKLERIREFEFICGTNILTFAPIFVTCILAPLTSTLCMQEARLFWQFYRHVNKTRWTSS